MTPPDYAPLVGLELRPTGSLVEKALSCLASGPQSTPALAAQVLSLRGNPRAAAAAVFALLGTDARFRVDGEGTWSLATAAPIAPAEAESTARPLRLEEWVVVDVETTGGSKAHGHRVIEVAAVRVVEGRVAETFTSLVNPGRPVPRMITSLTGITGEMVAGAPPFTEIAARLESELLGRVFVGHNAGFDWGFISAEMERCTGRELAGPQLCTLRLARRILPHLPSRSLGALAEYFGIGMDAHHRALDDALATAKLLLRFLDALEDRGVTDWDGLEAFFRPPRRPRRKRSAFPQPLDAA